MREAASVPIVVAIASLLVLAACAVQPQANGAANPPAGNDCFNVQFLTGYENVDRDTLRLRAGLGASHEVDISGAQCSQIDWAHWVAIESIPSSWICVGNRPGQGMIAFRDPTTRRRVECFIDDARRAPEIHAGAGDRLAMAFGRIVEAKVRAVCASRLQSGLQSRRAGRWKVKTPRGCGASSGPINRRSCDRATR